MPLWTNGAFALEFEHYLGQVDEAQQHRILMADGILADYHARVAADRQKRTPSGAAYYSDYQLSERQQTHAEEARDGIRALRPKELSKIISDLEAKVKATGGVAYDERRIEEIRHELRPMIHEPLEIRPRFVAALERGDWEVVAAIMDWPGHGDGELLKDQLHSDKLVPKGQGWRQSPGTRKAASELQTHRAYLAEVDNLEKTAVGELGLIDTEIVMLPMSGGSAPEAA